MRIALAQINTTQGDIPSNMAAMRSALVRAVAGGARLVLFPELSLCGYCPRDVLFQNAFVKKAEQVLREFAAEVPPEVAVLIGSIRRPEKAPGRQLLNTAWLLENGEARVACDKRFLPTYDVFDEARYFIPGNASPTVEIDGVRIGVTICEDIWSTTSSDPGMPHYSGDPPAELVKQGAELILNLSASPFALGKIETRNQLVRSQARRLGVPFALCNLVGGNDEVIFDGSSLAVDREGHTLGRGAHFEEDLILFEHDAEGSTDDQEPLIENEQLRRALVLGIRDYAHKSGFRSAVLGLSGGIDSALTAALAEEALGGDNVLGISMPSRYSADMSHDDAKMLADSLGMRFEVIPIGPVFDSTLEQLEPHVGGGPADVTQENLQPRIRGMYLMALSNKHHALLLTTGNKSELSVGYCTLYGDMCGGLAVISDLPKKKVYDLSRYLNEQRGEVIPPRTIERPPSAELRPDQKDSDTLPDYDVLDEVLRLAVEEGCGMEEIVAQGFDAATVRDVLRKLWRNEFKRKQMPPGLKVTSKAFGVGRRMPLTGGADWINNEKA